jgi:hypothetical protein
VKKITISRMDMYIIERLNCIYKRTPRSAENTIDKEMNQLEAHVFAEVSRSLAPVARYR